MRSIILLPVVIPPPPYSLQRGSSARFGLESAIFLSTNPFPSPTEPPRARTSPFEGGRGDEHPKHKLCTSIKAEQKRVECLIILLQVLIPLTPFKGERSARLGLESAIFSGQRSLSIHSLSRQALGGGMEFDICRNPLSLDVGWKSSES